jgi:endonuclease/exonuclease/phosphatase (EEP) superfamily protein YafD
VLIGGLQFVDGRFRTAPVGTDFVLYQKNLLYFERDRTAFVADVIASGADVVTLQEVSRVNEAMLEQLRPQYPHQLFCNARNFRKNAVVSRTPLDAADCDDHSGFARVVTQVRGRSVQVYGLHLYWPYPYRQAEQVAQMVPVLTAQNAPFSVVAGDFNMTPWGRGVAAIERATYTDRIGQAVWTYDLYGYPLAIDHILATGGVGTLEARPMLGSDHRGLVARIDFP